MLHSKYICLPLILLFTVSVVRAERPTPVKFQKAVQESLNRYTIENPSKQEVLVKKLEKELEEATQKKATSASQRSSKKKEVAKLQERLDEAKTELESKAPEMKLSALPWGRLEVGDLGHVGECEWGGVISGRVYVAQVVDTDRFLGYYEYHLPGRTNRDRGTKVKTGIVLFVGVDTTKLYDDRTYTLNFSGVVTGKFQYEDTSGAMTTVPLVEKFELESYETWK